VATSITGESSLPPVRHDIKRDARRPYSPGQAARSTLNWCAGTLEPKDNG
jgi:hypothetical protein